MEISSFEDLMCAVRERFGKILPNTAIIELPKTLHKNTQEALLRLYWKTTANNTSVAVPRSSPVSQSTTTAPTSGIEITDWAGSDDTATTADNVSIDNGTDSANIITSSEVGKVGDASNDHEKKQKEGRGRDSSAENDHALRLIINIILSAIDEINHGSLESVDTLIRRRLIAHGIKVNSTGMQGSFILS